MSEPPEKERPLAPTTAHSGKQNSNDSRKLPRPERLAQAVNRTGDANERLARLRLLLLALCSQMRARRPERRTR